MLRKLAIFRSKSLEREEVDVGSVCPVQNGTVFVTANIFCKFLLC